MFIQLNENNMESPLVSERDFPWQLGGPLVDYLKSKNVKGLNIKKIKNNDNEKIQIDSQTYEIATIKSFLPEAYCERVLNKFAYFPAHLRISLHPACRWRQLKLHFYCHSVDGQGNLRGFDGNKNKRRK